MPELFANGNLPMAKMSAEAWYFLDAAQYAELSSEDQEVDALKKWRKLLAIMEVALRYPIYCSRYAPEVIVLSWFFGLPSFGREQDMAKLKRIPVGVDKKWLERWTQTDIFKKPPPLPEKVAKSAYEGDDAFQIMCVEIEDVVLKTLK